MHHIVKELAVDQFVKESTEGADSAGQSYWPESADRAKKCEFLGTSDPDEARRLGTLGWPEGTAIINGIKVRLEGELKSHNRQYEPVHDVTGSYVDVGRYCEGVPECMLSFEESEAPQPGFVWIHVSTGVNAAVSTSEIQLQGGAVGALVDALESAGQRVKLTWERSSISKSERTKITLWMTLKEYNDPLDIDRVAFFLTHNAPRRPMAWHLYLKNLNAKQRKDMDVKPGHAGCMPWSHPTLFSEADVRVDHMLYTEERAAQWVLETLAKNGIAIE